MSERYDAQAVLGMLISADDQEWQRAVERMNQGLANIQRASKRATDTAAAGAKKAETEFARWEKGLQRIQHGIARLGNFSGRTFQTMLGLVMRLTAAFGGAAAGAAAWGLQLRSQIDSATRTIANFVRSNSTAQAIIGKVREYAAKTPFFFSALAGGARQAAAFRLFGQGGPSQWAYRFGALAAGGLGTFSGEDVQQAARATGYLRTGRKGEAMEALARMGVTPDDLARYGARYKRTSVGVKWESSNEELIQALAQLIDDRYVPALEGLSRTLGGRWSTFMDNVQGLLADATEGLYELLVVNLGKVNDWFEKLQTSPGYGEAMKSLGEMWKNLGEWGEPRLQAMLQYLGSPKAFEDLKRFGRSVVDVFGPAWGALSDLARNTDPKRIGELLKALVEGLGTVLRTLAALPPWAQKGLVVGGVGAWALNATGVGSIGRGVYDVARAGLGRLGAARAAAGAAGAATASSSAVGAAGAAEGLLTGATAGAGIRGLLGRAGRFFGGPARTIHPFAEYSVYRRTAVPVSQELEWAWAQQQKFRGSYGMYNATPKPTPTWTWQKVTPWWQKSFAVPSAGQLGGAALSAGATELGIGLQRGGMLARASQSAWEGGALVRPQGPNPWAYAGSLAGQRALGWGLAGAQVGGPVVGAITGGAGAVAGGLEGAFLHGIGSDMRKNRAAASLQDLHAAQKLVAATQGRYKELLSPNGQYMTEANRAAFLGYVSKITNEEGLSQSVRDLFAERLRGKASGVNWNAVDFIPRQQQAAANLAALAAERNNQPTMERNSGFRLRTTAGAMGYGQAVTINGTFYINDPGEVGGIVREMMADAGVGE